mgnify:FL=1
MIYNNDRTIGVDYKSYEKLSAIAERMLNGHNNETDQFLNDHFQIINYDH